MKKAEFNRRYGDYILTEADEAHFMQCVRGSEELEQAMRNLYAKRAKELKVHDDTAALYLLYCQPGEDGLNRARMATGNLLIAS